MMRPRIPVWQRRLMRPEFNGQSPAPGPWRPGGPDSPMRGPGPGPRGLLDTPVRAPLHARTPYDRPTPSDAGPPGRAQAKVEELPETQKQLLGMIDLAQKQLEMEREKILNQFSPKDGSGPPGSGLLGERPDGPTGMGGGPLGKGLAGEKPGLLGRRPDQKFPGPNMDAGSGSRMNGVRPPFNGPRPLMGVQVRPTAGMDSPRGPMPGPRGSGFGGPRGPMSGPGDMPGPRGPAANPRQMGPMGMQNNRMQGPMQNPGQMGPMGMQDARQGGPMQNPRQMGHMQNSRQMGLMDDTLSGGPMQNPRSMGRQMGLMDDPLPGGPMQNPRSVGRQMGLMDDPLPGGPMQNPRSMGPMDDTLSGPMQNPRSMGARSTGLNGPVSGPRPLMGGLSGSGGLGLGNASDMRGSLPRDGGGMSRSQLPTGGLQRPGLSSQPLQGLGDWRQGNQQLPLDSLSRSSDLSWQQPQGVLDRLRGHREDSLLGRGTTDFRSPRLDDYNFDSGFRGDRFLQDRIEDRRFQPTLPDPLYPSRLSNLGGRDYF